MAIEKWAAGGGPGFTWTSVLTTELNALANGNAVIQSVAAAIANQTNLDLFADLSFEAGGTMTTAAPGYLGFYLYPQNHNAIYGDGAFGTTAAGPPPSNYAVGAIGFPIGAGITIHGVVTGIIIPPGNCKFLLYNQAGNPLPATGNVVQYRVYDRSVT